MSEWKEQLKYYVRAQTVCAVLMEESPGDVRNNRKRRPENGGCVSAALASDVKISVTETLVNIESMPPTLTL